MSKINQRDWDGLRELISADARLQVADRFRGPLSESSYFGNYERWTVPWRMALGEVDGEPVIIRLHRAEDVWTPKSVVRLDVIGHHIAAIADYGHCRWVLPAAASVIVGSEPPPN